MIERKKHVGWLYRSPNGPGFKPSWVVVIGNAANPTNQKTFMDPPAAIEFAEATLGQKIELEETLTAELGYRILVPDPSPKRGKKHR